jgi:hypothetical protein
MSELAHITRNVTPQQQYQQEQRRTKLQEALSGIQPAKYQQEIDAALDMDKERRLELKSKLDELSTDELERMLSISSHRAIPQNLRAPQEVDSPTGLQISRSAAGSPPAERLVHNYDPPPAAGAPP